MCYHFLLIAIEEVSRQPVWELPAGRREGHSTHLHRASAAFRCGCPACCSLSQLAVEGTLVLLVLVSAAPGDSILCAVNKLFYSCRVCCLKLLLWCRTLLKRVMRQLQMSPQKQCFHGSEHWSVTGWTSAIAEINCIAFEVAFFPFFIYFNSLPWKTALTEICYRIKLQLLWNLRLSWVPPAPGNSAFPIFLVMDSVLEETLSTASDA